MFVLHSLGYPYCGGGGVGFLTRSCPFAFSSLFSPTTTKPGDQLAFIMDFIMPSSSSENVFYNDLPQSPFKKTLNFCKDTETPSNDDFVDRLLKDISRKQCEKWGFDFELDQPMPSSSNSRFEWTVVKNEDVPFFYRSVEIIEETDSENRDPMYKKKAVPYSVCQKKRRPAGLITPRKQPSITEFISRRKHTKQASPISKPLKPLNQRSVRRFSLQP
ncbi:unnamed protein product [Bursaphelenchus okinawaensis]|uniref:Cyclin-dependent kinase inhibitor domain-containing protein n=1 Tax=Bursaphelenchus okinawaensis TaxID=465554 RepID=A0A811K7E8_9BILA|nr:unnamed protein product [Bursaphelenchus okinawaensis]CAG9093376.1 unnamed protein product [Bursaphelenchus okinawaensis]